MSFLKNLKEKMGIPENIQPVIEKMSEFTAAVQKLTAGLADGIDAKDFEALKDMLSKFDSVNVIIPDGPAKATLQGLRSQAMTMLASVKGAEPLLAMLKAMEKKEEAAPAAPTPAAPVAAAAPVATPAVAVAPPAPAAPVASVAPVAPVTPVASVAPSGPIAPIAVETPATTETA